MANEKLKMFEVILTMNQMLTSANVATDLKVGEFTNIINHLIKELVSEQFELQTDIRKANSFKISISGIPNKDHKVYRICFDLGLFKMIYDTLYVVLSNNKFFSGIGESTSQFKIPTIEVPNWTILDIAMSCNSESVYFDEDRIALHEFLYTLCLHFIARHEIRHIANGHIGYLNNKSPGLFYENSKNGLEPIDSQTLEMDVDSCVFCGMIDGLLNKNPRSRLPLALQTEKGIFDSLLFVLKILFYCLPSKKVSSLAEIQNRSHPNSCLRYFFSFTAGLSLVQEQHPELFNLLGKTYQTTWSDFEILNKQGLLSWERVMKDYEWTMSTEGMDFADRIWNNWNNWVPKLTPFAYLKLAPLEN